MPVEIRPGNPGDAEAAYDVWEAAIVRRRGQPPTAAGAARVRERLDSLVDWVLLVAEDEGEIIGMAMAAQARDDDGLGCVVPGLCHISLVFVAPHRWREGVGAALMDALLADARARGYERAQLWVHEDNAPAQHLYIRCGSEPTERTKPDDEGETIRLWRTELTS